MLTIVISSGFSPRDLQLHLSSQGIQSAVLNTFNRLFGRLKFDYGVTNLIVIGEMNHVVYATNQIMKSNVLKLKSNVVVLCVDCKAVPKLRNPRDIYGNVLWAIPDNVMYIIYFIYSFCFIRG